ncbi:MAG: gamma-glutamyltransferase family protein [Usitatibacter sp.]
MKNRNGMIVAPQPEAVEAGALVLEQGGNAVDAAIVCALVQGVVDPQMTGIAGFGSMQIFMPGRGVHETIDFHARCPAAVRPDMWADKLIGEVRDGFGFRVEGQVNDVGYQSIAVPGSLMAYAQAAAEFGTMEWKDVVQPAIDECRAGFVVRPHVHGMWVKDYSSVGRVDYVDKLRFTEPGRRIYFHPDGRLKGVGERIHNPGMLASLERIARHGYEIFYRGEMADEIDADMRANGGLLRRSDLESYGTRRGPPLWGRYRGRRIATAQPPGGGLMMLEILHILDEFDLRALGHNSSVHLNILAEAMKHATIDKDRHIGDPEFVDVPAERLLSRDHVASIAAQIAAGKKANVVRLATREAKNTTTLGVIDGSGNVVCLTHSLGAPSGVITPGLGFMYNGCLGAFDPRPGRAGSLAAGKSRFASMAPSIVFEGERPSLVIGAPGGAQIPTALAQVISNVLDFDMPILEAVVAARISATSNTIEVSNRIPRFVTRSLEASGHPVARNPASYVFAAVHAIHDDGSRLRGAADPQRDGMALSVTIP